MLIAHAHEGRLKVTEWSNPVVTEERLRSVLKPQVDAALKSLAAGGRFAA